MKWFLALSVKTKIIASVIILLIVGGSAIAFYAHASRSQPSATNPSSDVASGSTLPGQAPAQSQQKKTSSSKKGNSSSQHSSADQGQTGSTAAKGASGTSGTSGSGSSGGISGSGGTTSDPCDVPTYPTASCVGVPAGTQLRSSGSINAVSGQVIENLDITGQVYIGNGVHDVMIRNTRFNGNGSEYWAIETEGSGSVTASHVTIQGNYLDAGVSKDNVTLTYANITGMTHDGIKVGSNSRYEHNWLHDFKPAVGAHSDGMQIFQREANVTIRYNYVDAECAAGFSCVWNANDSLDQSTNSALILNESIDQGTAGPITVSGNLLAGGGFTLYFDMPSSVTTFSNNKFVRNSYRWGAVDDRAHATTWTNNTYLDNGQVIT